MYVPYMFYVLSAATNLLTHYTQESLLLNTIAQNKSRITSNLYNTLQNKTKYTFSIWLPAVADDAETAPALISVWLCSCKIKAQFAKISIHWTTNQNIGVVLNYFWGRCVCITKRVFLRLMYDYEYLLSTTFCNSTMDNIQIFFSVYAIGSTSGVFPSICLCTPFDIQRSFIPPKEIQAHIQVLSANGEKQRVCTLGLS